MKSPAVLAAEAAAKRAADKYVSPTGQPRQSRLGAVHDRVSDALVDTGQPPECVMQLYRFIVRNYARKLYGDDISGPVAMMALQELTGLDRQQLINLAGRK